MNPAKFRAAEPGADFFLFHPYRDTKMVIYDRWSYMTIFYTVVNDSRENAIITNYTYKSK